MPHQKLIFIHIPKTAGSSIRELGQVHNFNHASIREVQHRVPSQEFQQAFKFAFIRNPYDRMVSLYHYFKRMKSDHKWYGMNRELKSEIDQFPTFDDFVLNITDTSCLTNYHFFPQSRFVLLDHGKLGVDFLGRFEHLARDWRVVASQHGLNQDLPNINAGQHRPWQEYYRSIKIRQLVYDLYAMDFERFAYPA